MASTNSNLRILPPAKPRATWEAEARRRFRLARQQIGTQLTVSIALGVSTTSLEDWERGAVRVPAWALHAVEELAAMGRAA